ncbi:MAG: hypothetical protein DWQ05_21215 [Calditrichaeota bacterium]|nr:MAG: hypothetical protein DWQ05_21215 [Calditrichota bacterium]
MSSNLFTRPDSTDFRDLIYQPTLIPLRSQIIPALEFINIRHQGYEGACTGFALAALIDYFNHSQKNTENVSARMLYEMAKRHDQWPGENYQGSSARGAMKGWQKNGVCPDIDWPFIQKKPGYLTAERQRAAFKYPLGAYYRIHRRRNDLQAAINETGAVFVTAASHKGWENQFMKNGWIDHSYAQNAPGGHAFVLLGYTAEGFIIQNSWGENWGGITLDGKTYPGCALWSYYDAELNMWDAWIARTALPIKTTGTHSNSVSRDGQKSRASAPAQYQIRDHYVHIDDGIYDEFGDFPSNENQVAEIMEQVTDGDKPGNPRHIVLYAHGSVSNVKAAAKRVAAWRQVFAKNKIHEIHYIWEAGLIEELKDVVLGKENKVVERTGEISAGSDRIIERFSQPPGHALWQEMQAEAFRAFQKKGAGTDSIDKLIEQLQKMPPHKRPEIHLVGHSTGAIWLGHLLKRWRALDGPTIKNLILFAPACTTNFYNTLIYPALVANQVQHLHHFQLDKNRERHDNVAQVYRKSILYLVSQSFQKRRKIVPIMGMEKYQNKLKNAGIANRLSTYNPEDNREATRAENHGNFDNDATTMNRMLEIVIGKIPKHRFSEANHLRGY